MPKAVLEEKLYGHDEEPDSNTKLGFMRSITVNGKEYVVIEL